MENKDSYKKIFHSLLIIFIAVIISFLISFLISFNNLFSYSRNLFLILIAVLGLIYFIQGVRLILNLKSEKGKLKLFLILTGISAATLLPSGLLHNLFYGLAIRFENFKYLFEVLSGTFFIIAVIIAPIIFIIGVIGSIIIFRSDNIK